jgi:hypothetical protein
VADEHNGDLTLAAELPKQSEHFAAALRVEAPGALTDGTTNPPPPKQTDQRETRNRRK